MNFLKHHILIIIIAAVAGVGIVSYSIWGASKPHNLTAISVSRMTLQEEVRGDGNVKAAEAVDLAFERGGKITQVYGQTGAKVIIGQPIVALDSSDLSAQLAQAQADVKTQQAKLAELKRGARPEDLENQNITVQNSKNLLDDANRGMIDKLKDAYTKADDAVRNKADQMFSNPQTDNPRVSLFITDSQLQTDINWGRLLSESTLKKWKTSLDVLDAESDFSVFSNEAKQNLQQISSFLEKLSLAINNPGNCVSSQGGCQPIPNSLKNDIATARTNVNTAISNISAAEGSIDSAKANFNISSQGLVIKEAGSSPEQIIAQEAQLDRSLAAASMVRAQLAKTVLRSPIGGTISRQDGKVGAVASPNQPIVSVLSNLKYQIEIFVSETDIAKIKIGQSVKVTLDAFGSEEFAATVIKTDPAATSANGIDAYKVTLQFLNDDERIKVGMGANIKINTASSENVIAVPESAIITRGNDKIVLVKKSGSNTEERKVKVGIKNSEGYAEVISGLSEGDQIVIFNRAE